MPDAPPINVSSPPSPVICNPPILGLLAIGVALLAWWVRFELRHLSPMVDLRTSSMRPLLFTNLASLLLGVMMFTNLLLTTRRLQHPVTEAGFGWNAATAGLAMLPTAAIMFAVAPFSARMAQRHGARFVLVLGSAIGTLGYVGAALAATTATLTITWTTLISAGVGIGYAALPMLIVEHAPAREIGSAVVGALTAQLVVTNQATTTPSHVALLAIAIFRLIIGVVTTIVSTQARASKQTAAAAA